MRISDWSSDVCSSDLAAGNRKVEPVESGDCIVLAEQRHEQFRIGRADMAGSWQAGQRRHARRRTAQIVDCQIEIAFATLFGAERQPDIRSEERRVGKGCVRTFSSRWAP